ncbi:MAG: family 43 glycosylhydrolase [Clostridia bacterium]|nr:family 43 glycosylhydrolase [Clostridia bacterium]
MKFDEINIRDPFILAHDGKYYLYGTRAKNTWEAVDVKTIGFDVYVSDDMENWSEPKEIFSYFEGFWGDRQYWAPEVHYYKGKFYMLASFVSEVANRGTAILVSDTPNGRFVPHSCGAVTPSDWSCLDGTLWVEDGVPYIVFCHEWTQIKNGAVCALRLSDDLKEPIGEPIELWCAGDAPWCDDIRGNGSYVTDGPFLLKVENELISIWSSFSKGEYVEAIARSHNGKISGKWTIDNNLLFEKDGGHGMIFTDLKGQLSFVYHTPNTTPFERPAIKKISYDDLRRK